MDEVHKHNSFNKMGVVHKVRKTVFRITTATILMHVHHS
jgi:hypothetical protein